jgi:hypothetical protein
MRWAPTLLLPSPLRSFPLDFHLLPRKSTVSPSFPLADFQLTPHYPSRSPLEDVLRLVEPGLDGYITEKHCAEIAVLLNRWS